MEPVSRSHLTEDEYLAGERRAEHKSELLNGELVAMAGGSPRHNLIAANLARAVGNLVMGGPCFTLSSDQRVHVPATGLFTYPDLTVVCGRPEWYAKDSDTLMNPSVLFEVLSESTEAYDRGAKFAHYRTIASLREYVMISRAERVIEHYRRVDAGQWIFTEYRGEDAAVALPTLGGALSLGDVFARLELLDAS